MAEISNIDKLLNMDITPKAIDKQALSEQTISPIPPKQIITKEMMEFAKEQVYQKLKSTNKPVSKMTDEEKLIFAEKEQEMIEDYEMFMCGKRSNTTQRYSNKDGVFFSPVASTVLDEYFTNGHH